MAEKIAQPSSQHEKKLLFASILTGVYLIAEIVGGVLTGSLALLSDAAHMFTDVAALIVALIAIQIAKRPADRKRTYGYYRIEILAAAGNAIVLFLVALYICYEAYERFYSPVEIQSTGMLVVALIGLVVNFLSMKLLKEGSEASLNVKGAYLEVWSDFLGSIGVILAAVLVRYTSYLWIDPLIGAAIGLLVLPRTWTLLGESLNVLLEGVPDGIVVEEIEKAFLQISGVTEVHELHISALTSGKVTLTSHLTVSTNIQGESQILEKAKEILTSKFQINHSTIQIEKEGSSKSDALNF